MDRAGRPVEVGNLRLFREHFEGRRLDAWTRQPAVVLPHDVTAAVEYFRQSRSTRFWRLCFPPGITFLLGFLK